MNHGTATTARSGCACDACRAYRTKAKKLWRYRTRVDSADKATRPTYMPVEILRDHVDRLVASGWRKVDIAREAGYSQSGLWNLMHFDRHGQPKRYVYRDKAAPVLALQPLEPVDVDDVLVERFIQGRADWQQLTATERKAAAVLMDRRGVSRAEIERMTHLNTKALYGAWEAS